MWALRSPRGPRPGPESTELGPETPGLANLVAHRFNPTRDAVPATLVDLAARGLIEIEDRGIGRYYCRLTGKTAELTPYERMLVDHLRSLAADGVIPAEALTTGPQDRSKAWWNEFRKKVVEHAQAAGLCTNLWNGASLALLVGGGVVLVVLYALATGFNRSEDVAKTPLLNAVTLGALPAIFALGAVFKSTRQTSTAEGLRCGARWLGVRRALEESPSFSQLPPSGVVVWERHLAYAAALGAAPRSVRALPMGAESDTEVWARAGIEWRKVEVKYPRFRPGWGRHPLHALGVGILGTLFARWLLRLVTGDLGGDGTWLKVTAAVLFGVALFVLARSLPQLLWGFLDLFASRDADGTVLRARTRWSPFPYAFQGSDQQYLRYFVAIDDGHSPRLTAYRVKPSLYEDLRQGTEAKLKVTPNLGYVSTSRPGNSWVEAEGG